MKRTAAPIFQGQGQGFKVTKMFWMGIPKMCYMLKKVGSIAKTEWVNEELKYLKWEFGFPLRGDNKIEDLPQQFSFWGLETTFIGFRMWFYLYEHMLIAVDLFIAERHTFWPYFMSLTYWPWIDLEL